MIITISGNPGSGKSTVAKILVEKLSAERIYAGGIRREMARQKGMSVIELNQLASEDPKYDTELDEAVSSKARELEKQGKIVVVEGRVQFHFIPESIKVYIKVRNDIGAERIWQDLQKKDLREKRNEGEFSSQEELLNASIKREESSAKRYIKYYGIDHRDLSQYDFVVDSSNINAEQVAQKVIEFLKTFKNKA